MDGDDGSLHTIPVEIVLDRTAFFTESLINFESVGRLMQFQNLGMWHFSFLKFDESDAFCVSALRVLRFQLVNVYEDLVPTSRQALFVKLWSESYRAIVFSPLLRARYPDLTPKLQSPETLHHLLQIMERFKAAQAPFTLFNYSRFFTS